MEEAFLAADTFGVLLLGAALTVFVTDRPQYLEAARAALAAGVILIVARWMIWGFTTDVGWGARAAVGGIIGAVVLAAVPPLWWAINAKLATASTPVAIVGSTVGEPQPPIAPAPPPPVQNPLPQGYVDYMDDALTRIYEAYAGATKLGTTVTAMRGASSPRPRASDSYRDPPTPQAEAEQHGRWLDTLVNGYSQLSKDVRSIASAAPLAYRTNLQPFTGAAYAGSEFNQKVTAYRALLATISQQTGPRLDSGSKTLLKDMAGGLSTMAQARQDGIKQAMASIRAYLDDLRSR